MTLRTIPLRSRKYPGLVALVDDADYKFLTQYRWFPNKNNRSGGRPNFYALTWTGRMNPSPVRMHKMLTDWPRVDHVDGNGLNNQRDNLRPASQMQNLANQWKRAAATSRFKGVCWRDRPAPWRATITIDGRQRALGHFAAEEEAAHAYDAAAVEFWGEFARLNFPDQTS